MVVFVQHVSFNFPKICELILFNGLRINFWDENMINISQCDDRKVRSGNEQSKLFCEALPPPIKSYRI